MSEALFKAVFTDNFDIGDITVLTKLAEDCGLDGTIIRELLGSDKDKADVMNEIFYFRNLGVSGVPTFIYNGQFSVQGAQPADTHVKALAEAAEHPANAN